MKSFNFLCRVAAVASLFFLLPACRKVTEVLRKDPDAIGQFCRIDTFSFGNPNAPFEQTIVSYNRAGDPVSIEPTSFILGEEFDDIILRYDRFGRLRDQILVVPGGETYAAIDMWQRYTYPRPRVVVDSAFNYDGPGLPLGPGFTLPDNPPPYEGVTISGYQQDERGRTIRTWTEFPNFPPTDTTTINYDRDGNLVRPGVIYDDKINIYRTNKVWQLIFQDYSTNNPVIFSPIFPQISVITAYNRWRLPKVYTENEGTSAQGIFMYRFNFQFPEIAVSYSCDGDSVGGHADGGE